MRKRGSWFNLGIMAVLALSLFTLGCDDSDSTVDPNVTVSGFVVDGPIVGVHVEVVDADGNIYRSSDPTDERGWYAVQVSRGAGGPLRVRTVGTAGDFNAVYHSILKMGKIENDRSDVHLTPMTTLIYFTSVTVAGGDDAAITAENVDAATVQVKALFAQLDLDFDPLSTTPVANEDMDDDDLTAVLSYRTAISALLGALDGDDDDGDDEEFGMSGAFPAAASALAHDLHDGAPAVSAFKTRLARAFSIVRVETLAAMIGQEAETLFEITIDLAVATARVTEKAEPPAFFTLSVVHVNDTHSHLDPTEDSLYFDGVQTYLEMGGYARLATEAATVRAANPNTLVLHAGDAVQGTLYFTQYDGVADLDLLNRIGFDAMAVGNHEFDRGPGFLAGFIDGADFPLLGANIDASADPNLSGKIAPYAIETLNGEKIGIIGLITPETRNISSPGDNIVFLDQAAAARNAIADLEARGVDKIIVLSHMSFELDKALAQTAEGIDIIVGGHSHTLLGDMEDLGKSTAGDYPVEIEGPNGDTIYIVHSWEWAKAVGSFEARFDGHGRVIAFDGAAALLVGDEFRRKDADGDKVAVDAAAKDAILAAIAAHPAVKVVAEDADLLAALAPYAEGIDDLQTEVIAAVSEDLLHIREPGQHTSGADLSGGSLIAPIVSEGMLWKANDVGLDADMAFQNAGGVRIDIPQGDLTVGTAYELLPFGNTMVALDLTGAEIQAALENGVERSSGAWPYVAGARYTVDVSRPEGQKIVSVEIMINGAWVALDETAVYRIVTNSYIASGGDGYGMLADAAGYRYDTGFVDAEVFMAYAEHLGTLTPPQTTYIVYMDGGATAEPRFAVFSDPHYFDPDLLINDGAAFQEYLARDRKLLKESEAILASTVDAIKNTAGLDFVLVPGDMTKDGAKTSHRKFANHIQTLENAGIPVYVVPGNHDIDNPHAHAYDGDAAIEVDTVSSTEFAQIYNDYGYGEAIARDPASLGYVAEPVPGLWLLALDSCRYAENDAAGKAVTGGRFSTETLNWITDRLAEAQAADKQVIAMMHHGLLEHFTGQSQANPGAEYVIENWETVSQTLAEAGLPVVFTGHFHAQDVAVKTFEVGGETVALTDVQTGSLVTYPNPYRIVDMKADGTLDIDSRYITEVDYDTGFMTFPEYAENYLLEGLNGLVYASLTMPIDQGGYGLPAEQAGALTPMIVAAFAAHYAGNESPDAETLAAVNDMLASDDPTTKSLGESLYVLWTDPTLDINVAIDLTTGGVSTSTVEKSWRVSASTDDMEEYVADGSVDEGSSDLELGYEKPGDDNQKQQIVGIRFQEVDIPKGARIMSAHIQFACDEADKYQDPFSVAIHGIDANSTGAFTTDANTVSSRDRTFASAVWADLPIWQTEHEAGPDQRTPDLSGIVQEIVNRTGWQPGNAMGFIFSGTGTRTVESFDGEEELAPLLTVRYIGREEMPTTARFRLVWNDDPTTTTTVAWDQVRGENPMLHYGPEDMGTDADAYPHSQAPHRTSGYHDMNNQFVRLTGLTPDTEYYFMVKDSEGLSERHWFRTAPDSPEPFTFISGADTKSIGEPLEAGRWTSTIVPKLRPLFVIFNGDFCTGDGTNSAYWQQWLDDWYELTRTEDGRLFPIIPVMGNHELGDHEVLYGIFDAGNHDPAQPEDYTYYALSIGGDLMRLYNLNSEVDSVSQEAFDRQTAWLVDDLAAYQNSVFKVGGFHKPIRPHTQSKSENDYLYDAWAAIFYDYGFDLGFTADSHMHGVTLPVSPDTGPDSFQGFVTDYDGGTMYVGEGAWGAAYRENNDDKPWTLQSAAFQQLKWLQVFPENGAEPAHIDIRTVITAVRDASGTMVSKVENAASLSESDPFSVPAGIELFEDDAVGTVIRYPMAPLEGEAPTDAIVDLDGEAVSYTEIGLSWTPPAVWADGSAGGQALMIKAGADGEWEMVVGNLAPDTSSHTLRFLEDGVDHYFKIRAWNRYGYSAYSNEIIVSTPLDERTRVAFQEGVDAYAGVYDVGYFQSNPDFSDPENYEMAADGNIDTPDSEEQALIRFENIIGSDAVPTDAVISKAILRVFCTGKTDSTVSIHRMLTGWSEDATWNSMDDGVSADGVEAVSAADDVADGIPSGEYHEFDVTASLMAWQSDPASNHGWVFLNSGDDGWDLATSEENDPDLRPLLTVYYDDTGDAPVELRIQVTQSSDDMEEYAADGTSDDGTVDEGSSDLELGFEKPGEADQRPQIVGIRFPGVRVPQGATITGAYIQFTCDEADKNQDPFNVTIYGEATDDAATFGTAVNDVSGRPETTAFADWSDVPQWTVEGESGPDQRTPDLSAIVQEIVDRGGWASGNAMAFFLSGEGTRTAESFDGSPESAPTLVLQYEGGAPAAGPIGQYRLVWTDDPATTMTVGFGQMDGADPYVKFGTTADLADAMTQETIASTTYANPRDGGDPDKVLESYFAKLSGLTPDTAYHFQVCNSAGCGDAYWFKTAPDAPTDFAFVAGGDTRTNETPRRHGNMLIAKIRPLFIAHGGDYMNDGTYDEWVQWLDEWQSTTSGDGRMYPVLPCHGNHENDVTDMMARIFNIPNPDAYYALNIAGDMMRLYTLNTELEPGVGYGAFEGQDATQWNEQADWFVNDIPNHRDSVTWLVANYHRPLRPHTSGKSEGTGRIAAWADAFYDNGLDLAVECDTHIVKYTYPLKPSDGQCGYQDFARDDAAGTVFIGEGSWGAPTRPTDDDKPWTLDSDSFWQFKVIHASPDALNIRTVKFGGQEDAADGIIYDPSAVTALTQAEQDADPFAMPAGLDLWRPLAGEVLTLPFTGADIEKTAYVCTGSEWRYRDDGAMPAAGWTAAGFDDGGWAAGNAQLGYGDGDETTVIDFGADENDKHLAYHFRKTFQVADPARVIRLELSLLRDDGAVVYLNGREVLRDNMPDGAIDAGTTAVGAIGGGDESAFSRFPLNPDILVAGTNVIAVSVHQADAGSSDVSFDLDLTGLESRIAGTPPAAPADLTATPLSISDIELTWTDAATDEVGYELQRKVADGAWEIHAPRLDADTGAFTDILLAEGETYAYRVRAFNAAGLSAYSAEAEAATLTNPTPAIYSEDFESGVLDASRMFAVSVASDHDWEAAEYSGNHHAYMNGYGADAASDDWLIGGPFNLNFYSDESLAFDSAYNYDGPALEVKVSTDYDPAVHADPNNATWGELAPTLPAEGNYTFVNSGEMDLSAIDGDAVFVAFRYVSTGTGGGDGRAWEVDNVVLRGHYDPPVLASADFDSGVISADMTYSGASNADWRAENHGGQDGAFMNGYGADAASNDWLFLRVPEIAEADNAVFSFDWYYKYDGPALKVMISTNYGGPADDPMDAAVVWQPLAVDFTGDAETWYNTGEIDISDYVGTDVHVAIVYESTGTGGGDGRRWGVDNLKATKSLPDSVNAAFTADAARVPTGETVGFEAQASGGTGPYTYEWAFGDGETGSGETTTHAYAAAGLYTVELTATDAEGNEAVASKTDLVEVFVQTPYEIPTLTADLRAASFNAYLNRSSDGELEADLAAADDPQAQKVAEILQRVRPDVVLLNEFDTVLDGTAVDRFRSNYLEVSQNGAAPITYDHVFLKSSNTGVPSGHDLNNDGTVGGPDDAFGYGAFEGQYGMVLLSRYPILESEARTFRTFLWKDMPGALLPDDPDTPAAADWYSADELAVFRLSSKSHWDVPVDVNGHTVHVLASHPTPPVFDGDEDRNGARNHDEIRFWADYATPGEGGYIYDDDGATGGLPADARFVILGDLNASPDEGDGIAGAVDQVLDAATVNETFAPVSPGGPENAPANPFAESHTADWKMRADYALPSDFGFTIEGGAVFWPTTTQDLYYLVGPDVQSSDHRLVYLDLNIVN